MNNLEFTVAATGSKGNSYILEDNYSALIIDAGISYKKIDKALNYKMSKVNGVLISHSHGDHADFYHNYLLNGIDVYMSKSTAKELHTYENTFVRIIEAGQHELIGSFNILPFVLYHDVPCMGFYIIHERANIVYLTDTSYSEYTFPNVSCWIVECNHSQDIVEENLIEGKIGGYLADRIMKNHMSLEQLILMFKANDLKNTKNIVLTHMSDTNSNEKEFINTIQDETGKPVYAAKNGLKIDL